MEQLLSAAHGAAALSEYFKQSKWIIESLGATRSSYIVLGNVEQLSAWSMDDGTQHVEHLIYRST